MFFVNVGNTHTRIAGCDGPGRVIDTADLLSGKEVVPAPAAVACVVPAVRRLFDPKQTFFLNGEWDLGIDFSLVERLAVGADRVANLFALQASGRVPGICVDCGTAITFELLDASCRFLGGAILPGRAMMRSSLHEKTGALPLIPLHDTLPEGTGTNTVDAMRLGVDAALVHAVRGLLADALKLPGMAGASVVGTGGDAPFFRWYLPELTDAGEQFTINGLRYAYARYQAGRGGQA